MKAEYDGAILYNEVRGRHIPTAIHFDYKEVYNSDCSFKSQKELETILTHVNISPNNPIVAYCTVGAVQG